MKLEYHAGTAIDIVSEPACTDCSISAMLPICELGKMSTFILPFDSLPSSSPNSTSALWWIWSGGSMWPNFTVFVAWARATPAADSVPAAARPADVFRKSRRVVGGRLDRVMSGSPPAGYLEAQQAGQPKGQ